MAGLQPAPLHPSLEASSSAHPHGQRRASNFPIPSCKGESPRQLVWEMGFGPGAQGFSRPGVCANELSLQRYTKHCLEEKYLLLVLLLQRQKPQVPDKGHGLYQLQQALPGLSLIASSHHRQEHRRKAQLRPCFKCDCVPILKKAFRRLC